MMTATKTCLSIVLAAGEGTRMKSARPKVLHQVAGRSMIAHVLEVAGRSGKADIAVVVGREAQSVTDECRKVVPGVEIFEQTERLGTAHAVLAARDALKRGYDEVLVLYGDTPLIEDGPVTALSSALDEGTAIAIMGFTPDNPTGYGRLIESNGQIQAIIEERDANEQQRAISFCNGGVMAFDGKSMLGLLDEIKNDNAKGEFYLTDAVQIARAQGKKVVATHNTAESVLGVNNRVELAAAEALWQERQRTRLMQEGVTMTDPNSVHLCYDTEIAVDVVIEPNVVFGPGVKVRANARIHAFSHLEGATIGEGAQIGPFARLRPGADIGHSAKVGNFCEVKKAKVGEGSKINHLSYIGDSSIGQRVNIGAGTITCNYDGFNKHETHISDEAFIGSNTSLVAPVTIGQGAYVASGSVITKEVPADALGFGRTRQVNKTGHGKVLKARFSEIKKRNQ